MSTTEITVYIDNKPYRFRVQVDEQKESTTYKVDPAKDMHPEPDFIPPHLEFNLNGQLTLKEQLKTAEQAQLARLIWQEILDKMNP
ncbi:hypothetical protein ACE38W_12990 [Chitinophaga sp. Hz27]|uniref:hypothetical protein n=1 Tax=Chitinophaga sp. Hz27 TaxID=3347169 RepID=UPI0035D9BD0D